MMTTASPVISFETLDNRSAEAVRTSVLDRPDLRNPRPQIPQDLPGSIGAAIVHDDDLVWDTVQS